MTVESELDLEGLKRIGRVVALTLREMKKNVRPGITTGELDEIGEQYLEKHGARSAPRLAYNFPGATCISINEEAAHGIPGKRVIQPGDLVNLDVSAELDGYFADTATMVAVPPVSGLKEKLCLCTQRALTAAIGMAKAGQPFNALGRAVESEARKGGFTTLHDLGGHGVGRGIHEEPHSVPNYYSPLERRRLTEGLVITIEPFLTTGAKHVVTQFDGWTLKTADGGLSAQYEHTLVVTRGRPIVVTAL
jgi:methionyl aminopeptidase